MDYKLKEWRNQPQSEHSHSAKIPRFLLEPSGSALPLFVPESNNKMPNLSVFPDPATTPSRFARVGGFFSLAQWQELELQALIFKYMLAGTAVPAELIQPIEKSFLSSPACNLHQQSHHFQPAMFQSGYWGRTIVDPEPDRCRRTDGKKWRCSRDVVTGHKYCERHVHRGRNRSRKPVEIPTQATSGGALKPTSPIVASPITAVSSGINCGLSDSSPLSHLLPFNQRSSESTPGIGRTLENHIDKVSSEGSADGRILRHFFDDWPRSQQEPNIANSNATPGTSTTCHSISDFSLKLSTGNVDELCPQEENVGSEQNQLNWGVGWGTQQVSSMGGPLAEALRSSTTNSSPTSVLHELRHGSGSETSRIST